VFDLILGCEDLSNVFKLMMISVPGAGRIPQLTKGWKLFEKNFIVRNAQKDSPKYTWLVCLIWLLINVGAQILVATLSIFWNMDVNGTIMVRGAVSISDLQTFQDGSKGSQAFSANAYGISGAMYPTINHTASEDIAAAESGIGIISKDNYYEYTFVNRNPDDPRLAFAPSTRTIQSSAKCEEFRFPVGNDSANAGWPTKNGWVQGSVSTRRIYDCRVAHS
jgi:hypothetical protein